MFIDYLTLMLINLTGGLFVLAGYIYFDLEGDRARRWVPGMLMSGGLALGAGIHMVLTWPLPGSFNILFGEMSVFFGVLLLGLAFVVWHGLELTAVATYATFVGAASILIGVQVLNLGLTKSPALSGAGFIWIGIVGLFAVPMLAFKANPAFRTLATAGLVLAGVLWGMTGYNAYWGHVSPFGKWKPASLQYQMEMNRPPGK